MAQDNDTKTCPVCKKEFTRQELKLNRNQWFLRTFCGRKCMLKNRGRHRGLDFRKDQR